MTYIPFNPLRLPFPFPKKRAAAGPQEVDRRSFMPTATSSSSPSPPSLKITRLELPKPKDGQKTLEDMADALKEKAVGAVGDEPGILDLGYGSPGPDISIVVDAMNKEIEDLEFDLSQMKEAVNYLEETTKLDLSAAPGPLTRFTERYYSDAVTRMDFDRSILRIGEGVTRVEISASKLVEPCRSRLRTSKGLYPQMVVPLTEALTAVKEADDLIKKFLQLLSQAPYIPFVDLLDELSVLLTQKMEIIDSFFFTSI